MMEMQNKIAAGHIEFFGETILEDLYALDYAENICLIHRLSAKVGG